MKSKLKIICTNILIFLLFIFITEVSIWAFETYRMKKAGEFPPEINYIKFHYKVRSFHSHLINIARHNPGWSRKTFGLEYNSRHVVVFGCSFAYGYNLKDEQTFTYKLSELIKRPVYNQAFTGWGIQHMLYQSKLSDLYNKIKDPEYVIFIYIPDHLRRLYLMSFCSWNILNDEFNLRYKDVNGHLEEIKNDNTFLNQFKRLYLVNEIQNKLASNYARDEKNKEEVYNFALKHFIESKNEMQKHWKDTKYVILFYLDYYESEKFKADLEKAGYIVINANKLTDENLMSDKYMQTNIHPNEAAWDLLTPLIAERLKLE